MGEVPLYRKTSLIRKREEAATAMRRQAQKPESQAHHLSQTHPLRVMKPESRQAHNLRARAIARWTVV